MDFVSQAWEIILDVWDWFVWSTGVQVGRNTSLLSLGDCKQYQIEAQQTVNTQPKEITYIGQTVHHSDGRVLEPRCQGHHCS